MKKNAIWEDKDNKVMAFIYTHWNDHWRTIWQRCSWVLDIFTNLRRQNSTPRVWLSKSISDQRQNRIQTLLDKHSEFGERKGKGKEMRTVPYGYSPRNPVKAEETKTWERKQTKKMSAKRGRKPKIGNPFELKLVFTVPIKCEKAQGFR